MKRAILGLLAGIGVVALAVGLLDRRQEAVAQHPYTPAAYAPAARKPAPPAVCRRRVDRRARRRWATKGNC